MKAMSPSAFWRSEPFCGQSAHAGEKGNFRQGDINYSTAAANNVPKVILGASESALHHFLPLHALMKVFWTSDTLEINSRPPQPRISAGNAARATTIISLHIVPSCVDLQVTDSHSLPRFLGVCPEFQ